MSMRYHSMARLQSSPNLSLTCILLVLTVITYLRRIYKAQSNSYHITRIIHGNNALGLGDTAGGIGKQEPYPSSNDREHSDSSKAITNGVHTACSLTYGDSNNSRCQRYTFDELGISLEVPFITMGKSYLMRFGYKDGEYRDEIDQIIKSYQIQE